jgi:hypothetical protein
MSEEQARATDPSNERLRIWLSFVKFMLGTVALGIVTIVVNWQIQDKQRKFEEKTAQNAFIAQFVDKALDNNPEKRRDFAEYFVRLTPPGDTQKRWEAYRKYADALVEKAIKRDESIEKQERELAQLREKAARTRHKGSQEVQQLKTDITKLETQVSSDRRKLAALRSEPSGVVVPSVMGLSSEAARRMILRQGLEPQLVYPATSPRQKDLAVVRQDPSAGTEVPPGSVVRVFLRFSIAPQ